MNTYSVIKIDKVTKEETTIAKNLLSGQVSALIGIDVCKIIPYSDKNIIYKKEYKITIDGETDHANPDNLAKRWDEMCRAARVLKNGGRIVNKWVKGKKVRYVEAKQ